MTSDETVAALGKMDALHTYIHRLCLSINAATSPVLTSYILLSDQCMNVSATLW